MDDLRKFWKEHPNSTKVAVAITVLLVCGFTFYFLYQRFWFQLDPGKSHSLWIFVFLWAAGSLVAFGVTNAVFWLVTSSTGKPTDTATVFSTFWAVVTGILLIGSVFFVYGDARQQMQGLLSIVGGGIAGWLLGMYISPQGGAESREFAKIGTAIAGIASGYTLKSAQTWIEDGNHAHYRMYLLLGAVSAALTTATIYNVRAYANRVTITFPDAAADPDDKESVSTKAGATVQFLAAVEGLSDTSVSWSLLDATDGVASIDSKTGLLSASRAGTFKVLGRSNGDPTLSDVVQVTVTA